MAAPAPTMLASLLPSVYISMGYVLVSLVSQDLLYSPLLYGPYFLTSSFNLKQLEIFELLLPVWHIGSSANLNLCRYAFVFPCPVTRAVNSGIIGILIFNLCSSLGKKDRHMSPFVVLVHCCCHCSSPVLLMSLANDVIGILANSMLRFLSSWAASLASLSAISLPSIPMWALTHLKCIFQFCVARCRIMFLIFSIR